MRHKHPVNQRMHDNRTSGEILADRVTKIFGSWRFIVIQTIIVLLWIAMNGLVVVFRWDPYPFILLNLMFSTQAAYAAPLILLSQNRQSERDRLQAEHDYEVNLEALKKVLEIHAIVLTGRDSSEKIDVSAGGESDEDSIGTSRT